MNNIILCGFMGCGKTTVGKELAALTGRRFVDMDDFIEKEAGMTVSEIFRRYGEADFRRRERACCMKLAGEKGLVIAAGGGALTFSENVEALKESGIIVFLRVSPETVLRRLEGDTTRPLLQRPDKEVAVRTLMAERAPLYQRASDVVISGEGDAREVAGRILEAAKQAEDTDR